VVPMDTLLDVGRGPKEGRIADIITRVWRSGPRKVKGKA